MQGLGCKNSTAETLSQFFDGINEVWRWVSRGQGYRQPQKRVIISYLPELLGGCDGELRDIEAAPHGHAPYIQQLEMIAICVMPLPGSVAMPHHGVGALEQG